MGFVLCLQAFVCNLCYYHSNRLLFTECHRNIGLGLGLGLKDTARWQEQLCDTVTTAFPVAVAAAYYLLALLPHTTGTASTDKFPDPLAS